MIFSTRLPLSITDQIQIAVDIIKVTEPDINSKSAQYIRDKINDIFKLNVTEEQVLFWLQPTLDEEIEDLRQQYKNLRL